MTAPEDSKVWLLKQRTMTDDGIDYRDVVAMEEDEIDAFLDEHQSGVLSLSREDEPYGFPVCYAHDPDEDVIYVIFGMHPGSKKVAYVEDNHRASLAVYDRSPGAKVRSAIASGSFHRVEDGERRETARELLLSNHCTAPLYFWGVDSAQLDFEYYRLDIEEKTGRDSEISWPSPVREKIVSMLEDD